MGYGETMSVSNCGNSQDPNQSDGYYAHARPCQSGSYLAGQLGENLLEWRLSKPVQRLISNHRGVEPCRSFLICRACNLSYAVSRSARDPSCIPAGSDGVQKFCHSPRRSSHPILTTKRRLPGAPSLQSCSTEAMWSLWQSHPPRPPQAAPQSQSQPAPQSHLRPRVMGGTPPFSISTTFDAMLPKIVDARLICLFSRS